VGCNDAALTGSPHAAFHRRSNVTASAASRSDSPCSACSTSTDATTGAGTLGCPRPDGNRSANITSGNTSSRCAARNANTAPGAADAQRPTPRPTAPAADHSDPARDDHPGRAPPAPPPTPRLSSDLLGFVQRVRWLGWLLAKQAEFQGRSAELVPVAFAGMLRMSGVALTLGLSGLVAMSGCGAGKATGSGASSPARSSTPAQPASGVSAPPAAGPVPLAQGTVKIMDTLGYSAVVSFSMPPLDASLDTAHASPGKAKVRWSVVGSVDLANMTPGRDMPLAVDSGLGLYSFGGFFSADRPTCTSNLGVPTDWTFSGGPTGCYITLSTAGSMTIDGRAVVRVGGSTRLSTAPQMSDRVPEVAASDGAAVVADLRRGPTVTVLAAPQQFTSTAGLLTPATHCSVGDVAGGQPGPAGVVVPAGFSCQPAGA